MSSLDSKINNLLAGQSLVISTFKGIVCSAERTADGKHFDLKEHKQTVAL